MLLVALALNLPQITSVVYIVLIINITMTRCFRDLCTTTTHTYYWATELQTIHSYRKQNAKQKLGIRSLLFLQRISHLFLFRVFFSTIFLLYLTFVMKCIVFNYFFIDQQSYSSKHSIFLFIKFLIRWRCLFYL